MESLQAKNPINNPNCFRAQKQTVIWQWVEQIITPEKEWAGCFGCLKPCGNKLSNCAGDKSAVVLKKNNEIWITEFWVLFIYGKQNISIKWNYNVFKSFHPNHYQPMLM